MDWKDRLYIAWGKWRKSEAFATALFIGFCVGLALG
jgi:hypothetical protein